MFPNKGLLVLAGAERQLCEFPSTQFPQSFAQRQKLLHFWAQRAAPTQPRPAAWVIAPAFRIHKP